MKTTYFQNPYHYNMVSVVKFKHFSLSSNKMLVIMAGIHKMLVRIANRSSMFWVCVVFLGLAGS